MDSVAGQDDFEKQKKIAIEMIWAAQDEDSKKMPEGPQEDKFKADPKALGLANVYKENEKRSTIHEAKCISLKERVKAEQEKKIGFAGIIAGFFGIETKQTKEIKSLKESLENLEENLPYMSKEEKRRMMNDAFKEVETATKIQDKSDRAWKIDTGDPQELRNKAYRNLVDRVQDGDRETIRHIIDQGVESALFRQDAAERREAKFAIKVDDYRGTRADDYAKTDDPHNLQVAYENLRGQREALRTSIPQEQWEQLQQDDEDLEFGDRLELEKAQEDVDAARNKWTSDNRDANKVLAAQAKWDVVESKQGARAWDRVAERERDVFKKSADDCAYMDVREQSVASRNAMLDSQKRLQKVNSGEINTAERPGLIHTPNGTGTDQSDGFRADPTIEPYADADLEGRYQDFKAQQEAGPQNASEALKRFADKHERNVTGLADSTPPPPATGTAQTQDETRKSNK